MDLDELEEELSGDHDLEAGVGSGGVLHDVNLDSAYADSSSSGYSPKSRKEGDRDKDSSGVEMSSFPAGSSSSSNSPRSKSAIGDSGGGGEDEDGDGDREGSVIDSLYKTDSMFRTASETWSHYFLRLLSRLFGMATFSWIKALLEVGNARRLEPEDLLRLSTRDSR